MTAEAKIERNNADEIAVVQESDVSLMPEGLLEGMSDEQVAELLG